MFDSHSYIHLIDQKILEPAMLLLKIIVIAENTPYGNTWNIYESIKNIILKITS